MDQTIPTSMEGTHVHRDVLREGRKPGELQKITIFLRGGQLSRRRTPSWDSGLRDIDNLAGLRLRKLLLAKPCIVSPAANARMRCHATRLLKLPG